MEIERGSAFIFGGGFGVVQSVNYGRGIALILLQNGTWAEMPLFLLAGAIAWLEDQDWEVKL